MIEIKSTILLFVCTCVLVQIGNGVNSLREREPGLEDFSPVYKRQQRQESASASAVRVVKHVEDNENEHNQSLGLETTGQTQNDTASSPDGGENKVELELDQSKSPSHNAQQDEDYVMDRPDSARLGEACSATRACTGDSVKCRNGVCSCQDNYMPMTDKSGNCEEAYVVNVPLRGACNRTNRCSGYFTECREEICSCMKGYTVSATERDICRERIHIHMDPSTKTDPTMIGVIVGLALMSVTLCVVMRLFAKARFRENRTIFNTANPRLMNVSLKKVKKQMTMSRSHGAHRGSQDSVVITDGNRHSAMQMNDRQTYLNRPENPILSTSIDEEPTQTSSLVYTNAATRNGNDGGGGT